MRIVMMGTGAYAVPTLEKLYQSPHNAAALFTRPDVAGPGRRAAPPNPMRRLAAERGTPVYDPHSVNSPEALEILRNLAPDLLVVCDYGQILAAQTLATARHGGLNLHASLLPKYRGAAPINWAIYHGESETGNTVIHMTARLDAGPCVAQQRITIGPDETAEQIEPRMADAGAALVTEAIEQLAAGSLRQLPQDDTKATRAPKLKKSDGRVDWSRTARQIFDQIRAFKPWPKTFTDWPRDGAGPVRLILDLVAVDRSPSDQPPGTVTGADANRLSIATGEGQLVIEQLQPAGKRVMTAAEFLRGAALKMGDRLGE